MNWAEGYESGRKIRYDFDRTRGSELRLLQYIQKRSHEYPEGVPRSIIMQGMGLKADMVHQLALKLANVISIIERMNSTGRPTVLYKIR